MFESTRSRGQRLYPIHLIAPHLAFENLVHSQIFALKIPGTN